MKYDLTTTDNGEFLLVMQGDEIIAHLPLKEKTTLLNVDLLPPLPQVDDVEKLVLEQYPKTNTHMDRLDEVDGNAYYRSIYKSGYNKAKETYKYTEEDLRKAIDMAQEQKIVPFTKEEYEFTYSEKEIIQSLQQPKLPIAFECEMATGYVSDKSGFLVHPNIKRIINSQNHAQWVGKYIYE